MADLGVVRRPGAFVEGGLASYTFHAVVGVKQDEGMGAIIQAVDGVEEAAEMGVEITKICLVIGHFFADLWGLGNGFLRQETNFSSHLFQAK